MLPVYATREDVMAALDVAETTRTAGQIDRLVAAASRQVDQLCHRVFYPTSTTRYLDWPAPQHGTSYRLWLDGDHEVISLTSVTSGGVALTGYFLEPQSAGPPYTRLEVDLSGTDSLDAGDTHQRSVVLVGVFGACADTTEAGLLAEVLDSSETAVDVSDSSTIGVGSLLLVDSEYMQVTRRGLLSTGQTISGNLAAAKAGTTVTVADASGIVAGEVVTIDAERMLVTDTTATTLLVERAWSGSVLAAHTSGATVYAPRTLTVERAQRGTQAAAHNSGATVYRHTPPPLVRQLTIAEALVGLAREQSGYARTVGSGEATRNASGADLNDLRKQVKAAHGRKMRTRSV
ncbi:MAG: hypothetical protein AB7W59_02190 [Acidimicrobiia bacterium]